MKTVNSVVFPSPQFSVLSETQLQSSPSRPGGAEAHWDPLSFQKVFDSQLDATLDVGAAIRTGFNVLL